MFSVAASFFFFFFLPLPCSLSLSSGSARETSGIRQIIGQSKSSSGVCGFLQDTKKGLQLRGRRQFERRNFILLYFKRSYIDVIGEESEFQLCVWESETSDSFLSWRTNVLPSTMWEDSGLSLILPALWKELSQGFAVLLFFCLENPHLESRSMPVWETGVLFFNDGCLEQIGIL